MPLSAYDLYLSRSLKHAGIERRTTASEAFDRVAAHTSAVAAGVRQVVERCGDRYLAEFIDEVRANGFIADALARGGQRDAAVSRARTV